MSQKTKLAFIASIVLNVLLVGVLLGQSPRRFDPRRHARAAHGAGNQRPAGSVTDPLAREI